MSELLPAIVAEPESGEARGTLIWLHGLGADGNDFVPVLPMLPLAELGLRVILPHAPSMPVTINGGFVMPAWYDIKGETTEDRYDEPGIRASAAHVEGFIASEVARGVPAERIALIGFSQGGAVALFAGLRHSERLAGLAALSTYLVLPEVLAAEASEANRGIPVFQGHGSYDPVVRFDWGETARDWLRGRGHEVEWHAYPMEHSVCPEEIEALGKWLEGRFA